MEYYKEYVADPTHIDSQGIVDGLYYPFYMEKCRHAFVKELLGFDIEQMAKGGINMVLSEYTLKFKRPLKQGDHMRVFCSAQIEGKFRLIINQKIVVGELVYTEATFQATCVPSGGGRPFLPESVITALTKN